MKKTGNKAPFVLLAAYLLLTGAFSLSIIAVPFLAHWGYNDAAAVLYHNIFSNICHQKLSRSYCVFKSDSNYWFGDCTPQLGKYVADSREQLSAISNGVLGYKFPVSARDMAIYLFTFVGGLLYPFLYKMDSERWPTPWLLVALLVPMAIDGFTQLFGWRESVNALRFFTGALAGIIVPFYLLPMLNRAFSAART